MIPLPHQLVGEFLNHRFDKDVRRNFFRGMEFAAPAGDPGWFGPDSAVWYVHAHLPTLVFGLQCAAFMERLDPSIYWMGLHHSRLVKRDENGVGRPEVDPKGALVRLGHSIAFFIGTAFGSTETAERLARTVRAMHHTVKGTRPDGARYDADSDRDLQHGVEMLGGDPRARHVYVREGALPDVLAAWRSVLGDDAWVVPGEQAIEEGWFGHVPDGMRERIGDVVAAMRGDAVVVRSDAEPVLAELPGQHGSLTPAEQLVPLLVHTNP